MVYLIMCTLLPFAAVAACPEGSGSCPSNSKALLQSSLSHQIQVDDGGQIVFEHLLSLQQSGESSEGFAKDFAALCKPEDISAQIQTRALDAVLGGKPLTSQEESLMKALAKMFETTTLPALRKGHKDDQDVLDNTVQALVDCNNNLAADSNNAATAKAAIDAQKKKHLACRGKESVLKSSHNKSLEDLKKFTDKLQPPSKPLALDPMAAESYFALGLRWFKDNQLLYTQKKAAYTAAKEANENMTAACNTAQSSYESGYCQWIGQATAASKSYARCWNQGGGNGWNQTLAAVLDSAKQRKLHYVAVKKMQCFLSSLTMSLSKKGVATEQNVNACKDLTPNASTFDLVNTSAPAKQNLATLGDTKSMPGDGAWKKSEYANISNEQQVTPCADALDENGKKIWESGNVTHFCADNEHIRVHRCMPCAPGKSRPAGDNAVGADTNCSAIHCPANHHVVSNECKHCAAGASSAAGDDASGPDTSCTTQDSAYAT